MQDKTRQDKTRQSAISKHNLGDFGGYKNQYRPKKKETSGFILSTDHDLNQLKAPCPYF